MCSRQADGYGYSTVHIRHEQSSDGVVRADSVDRLVLNVHTRNNTGLQPQVGVPCRGVEWDFLHKADLFRVTMIDLWFFTISQCASSSLLARANP